MKRTAEIVLTVIGLIFNLIGAAFTAIMVSITHLDGFRGSFEEGYNEGLIEGGYETGNATLLLNVLSGFGWMVVSVFVIGAILGIIAIFFYAGNKKPKAANIMMIISSVIIGIGTVLTGFLPALLYLIAGIVGFVRKQPTPVDHTTADTY